MFYRFNKARRTRKLNRAISGILDTPPLRLESAPWCIASMVANNDVAMYLLGLKSFYAKLGRGKVAAIVDRDMPQPLRDTLSHHVPGIEFVILEDIETGVCQHGGTWERLLYVLDRSDHEYTIQLDADTLTIGGIDEVIRCVETNTPFTMSDGFDLMSLSQVAEEAEATPSDYIGIVTERMFARYPDPGLHYVRGSSGFAGFSRGGFSRAAITRFHQEMEKLVGATRWREWGTEQCGSNFAIGNSPGATVLPFPEYASFTPHAARETAKFFHFIGANRFLDNYYAARGQELIAKLRPGSVPTIRAKQPAPRAETGGPVALARVLTPLSVLPYLAWLFRGQHRSIWLRLRSEREFPGPEFQLRPRPEGNHDYAVALDVFVHRRLHTPVRIPPERVKLIVDLGADVGMSCLYWLAAYWRTEVLAFGPNPECAAQCRTNLKRNGFLSRVTLYSLAADLFTLLAGRRIDILNIDVNDSEDGLLADSRFGQLDVRAIVLTWHEHEDHHDGYTRCSRRLQELGFELTPTVQQKTHGVTWAYKKHPATDSGADLEPLSITATSATQTE